MAALFWRHAKSGADSLSTHSKSKVLAKPIMKKNVKEESTPPVVTRTRSDRLRSSLSGLNCQILLLERQCLCGARLLCACGCKISKKFLFRNAFWRKLALTPLVFTFIVL